MTASSSAPSLDGLAPILGRWQSSGAVFDDAGDVETHITGRRIATLTRRVLDCP